MKIHRTVYKHRVTFSDCVPAHMAYHPRILEWFDQSTDRRIRSVNVHAAEALSYRRIAVGGV